MESILSRISRKAPEERLRESVLHDFHFAVGLLWRNGASTAVIVVAPAIGIAVNTAVFTAYTILVVRQLEARAFSRVLQHSVRGRAAEGAQCGRYAVRATSE